MYVVGLLGYSSDAPCLAKESAVPFPENCLTSHGMVMP